MRPCCCNSFKISGQLVVCCSSSLSSRGSEGPAKVVDDGSFGAAVVATAYLAVKSNCSVRAAYAEVHSRRASCAVSEEWLEAVEPAVDNLKEQMGTNRQLLQRRMLNTVDCDRLLMM